MFAGLLLVLLVCPRALLALAPRESRLYLPFPHSPKLGDIGLRVRSTLAFPAAPQILGHRLQFNFRISSTLFPSKVTRNFGKILSYFFLCIIPLLALLQLVLWKMRDERLRIGLAKEQAITLFQGWSSSLRRAIEIPQSSRTL